MHTALDIVIKNARIIDGTGNPYYSGDIGIANSLIERIGSDIPASDARKVINAEGQVACPGFFDTQSATAGLPSDRRRPTRLII
jgi:N-acyl-D-amino-acid deacylase